MNPLRNGKIARALVLAGAYLGAALCHGQAPDLSSLDIVTRAVPNGPVASVNGSPISRDEFVDMYSNELDYLQKAKGGNVSDADRVGLGVYCLGQVVQREILKQEAVKRGLSVPEEDIDKLYQQTLEAFKRASRGTGVTDEQVLESAGTTREEARGEIRKSLLIEKMRETIAKEQGVAVSDDEVMKEYEANKERFMRPDAIHMKQIYFLVPKIQGDAAAGERQKARDKAERVLKLLKQGQTFEALAKSDSDGAPEVKAAGGDMGPIAVDQLPPSLVAAAQSLKPGEVSGIIESPFGFHIIKLVEITSGEAPDMDNVRRFIRNKMLSEKTEKPVREYVQQKMVSKEYEVIDFLDLERELRRRPELVEELVGRVDGAGQ